MKSDAVNNKLGNDLDMFKEIFIILNDGIVFILTFIIPTTLEYTIMVLGLFFTQITYFFTISLLCEIKEREPSSVL